MRINFLLFTFALLSSLASGQNIYAPPVVTIDNSSQKFNLTAPPISEFRMLESLEYTLEYEKTSYKLVISFLDEPLTSEELKEMFELQFTKNPDAKVLANEIIDDWYLLQFSQSYGKIEEEEITACMEMLLTVWEGRFLIGISGEREKESDLNKNKLLDVLKNIKLVTPAIMDEYLGLPIPKNKSEALEEQAFYSGNLEEIANIKRNVNSQFSYFSYFNILSSIQEGRYSVNDMLDMFFDKSGNKDLAHLRNMISPDLNFELIYGNFPLIVEQFQSGIEKTYFNKNERIQTIELLNENDRTFLITYFDEVNPQNYMTRIIKFDKENSNWNCTTIFLPPDLQIFDPEAASWSIQEASSSWTIIRVAFGNTYYVKSNTTSNDLWRKISTLPPDTANYALVFNGCKMIENTGFFNGNLIFPFAENLKEHIKMTEAKLVEKNLAVPCDVGYYNYNTTKLRYVDNKCVSNDIFAREIQKNMSADKVLFATEMLSIDLNGDGKSELFSYAVSNGKIVHASGIMLKNNKLVPISKSMVKKWMKKNADAHNLKLYSKMKFDR